MKLKSSLNSMKEKAKKLQCEFDSKLEENAKKLQSDFCEQMKQSADASEARVADLKKPISTNKC